MNEVGISHLPFLKSKIRIYGICFFLTILIGIVRYLTGPELALSLFYLAPVALAAWYGGRSAGIIISLGCIATWLGADLLMREQFSSFWVPFLNETFRLIVFLIISHVLSKLKASLEFQKQLAQTDALTGIANRRAFYESVRIESNKRRRFNNPFSLLYLDLDNFKQMNDQHGHVQGDRLLCMVAMSIQQSLRVVDIAARIGGDEFCVLLSRTNGAAAKHVAEKIRKKIHTVAVDQAWSVTVSIGVITYVNIPESVDEIMQKADALMYAVKQNGKNHILHDWV